MPDQGPTTGCFTVSGRHPQHLLDARAWPRPTTVNVTVVTLGIAGAASYAYTDMPGTPAAPTATAGITSATVTWTAPAEQQQPDHRLHRHART